ncbi:SDR family oxidoreductase [Pseudonocardia alni]|uniref:SDR family oxidoreductase n=1 Tax=Pseudonocardia alni TaxID=33907 RepID=UPI0026575F1F|nr:SDR family oxidoreductase [Pseudonocardia alni]
MQCSPAGSGQPQSASARPQWLTEYEGLGNAMRFNLMPGDALAEADVSEVIAFLCSDAGKRITGTTVPVDAGFLLT